MDTPPRLVYVYQLQHDRRAILITYINLSTKSVPP